MQRNGYCRFSKVTVANSWIDVVLQIKWHQMWWPGWCPTRLHRWTMLIPPLTLVCEFGMSGLWLQDRTIRQLKEEAQHLSKLGVQHIMWGLDGLVLACLWRLCILSDTVLVFSVLVFLLLRRCLSYWLCYVQKLSNRSRGRTCPRHLHGLQCSVVLPI